LLNKAPDKLSVDMIHNGDKVRFSKYKTPNLLLHAEVRFMSFEKHEPGSHLLGHCNAFVLILPPGELRIIRKEQIILSIHISSKHYPKFFLFECHSRVPAFAKVQLF